LLTCEPKIQKKSTRPRLFLPKHVGFHFNLGAERMPKEVEQVKQRWRRSLPVDVWRRFITKLAEKNETEE
jgi:hypothetical protein